MDGDAIQQALAQLEEELKVRQLEVKKLEEAVYALRAITGAGEGTSTEDARGEAQRGTSDVVAAPSPSADGPRGREAVKAILEENRGVWVDMDTLTDEMVSRGWVESSRPREAVRTSADRLVTDDSLVEKGRGIYRLLPENVHRPHLLDPDAAEGGEGEHDVVQQ